MNFFIQRPLTRVRLGATPKSWHRQPRARLIQLPRRCFTTTRPSQGLLGLDRKDLRTTKSERSYQAALRKGKAAQLNEEARMFCLTA